MSQQISAAISLLRDAERLVSEEESHAASSQMHDAKIHIWKAMDKLNEVNG